MNDEMDKKLLELIRAADPAAEDRLRGWADSEAGQEVYARIVAARGDEQRAPLPKRPRVLRLALVAVGALVVIAAIVVAVILGVQQSPDTVVESSSTTAGSPGETVDRVAALYQVVRVAEEVRGSVGQQSYSTPKDAVACARLAESLGIIASTEHDSAVTSGTVSRGTYALWLWRGLGDLLPQIREVDFTDLGSLPADVRQAVLGVTGAGILEGDSNGRFEAERSLTIEEEKEAIGRLEMALGPIQTPPD